MMDRIEEMLQELCQHQDFATYYRQIKIDRPGEYAEFHRESKLMREEMRDALRSEIAADWRAMVEALEAEEDANAWDETVRADTIREMKERRIPIHNRWHRQIEALGYKHFNDSNQLRRLAQDLRRAAIVKARGE